MKKLKKLILMFKIKCSVVVNWLEADSYSEAGKVRIFQELLVFFVSSSMLENIKVITNFILLKYTTEASMTDLWK